MTKAKKPSASARRAGKVGSTRGAAATKTKSKPAPKPASSKSESSKAVADAASSKKSKALAPAKPPPQAKPVAGRGAAGGKPASESSRREKQQVPEVTPGKASKNSAAKTAVKAAIKAADKTPADKKTVVGKDGKVAKAVAAKAAAAKSAKGKDGKAAAAPPAPPRRIQVVQMSTLKPGARGTKASVKRAPPVVADGDGVAAPGAKKRRSAELTKQQLDHFTELLQQRRSRLSHDLSLMQDEALKVTAQDNSSDSVADTGTDNYEQDFTLGLIESEEALAREVDGALLRIAQSAFGVCESCQTPIPLARLEILPFARFCVECQQKRENKGGVPGA